MRYILLITLMLMIGGCDQLGSSGGRYSLFETSKGVIYRLDTKSGETEIIFSPTGRPKLTKEALFEGENKKTYLSFPLFSVFQGAGFMLPNSAHAEC